MTQLRIKLLVASVAALAVTSVAPAQVLNIGGRNGVTLGSGAQPYYGGNPVYGNAGYGYSPSPYYNGNYNGSWVNRGGYPGWTGYNQPTVTTMPGRNYFPSAGGYYNNPNPTYYTTPNTVGTYPVQNSGVIQQSGFTTDSNGTIVQSGFSSYPQQMNNGVVQTGAFSPQDWSRDRIVQTQVLAPDGAQVTLSGTQADRDQGARPFISPPLDPNKTYTYRAKATWVDQNGQTQTREKNVDVKAGQEVTIDLNRSDANNNPAVNDQNRTDEQSRTTEQSRSSERSRTTEQNQNRDNNRDRNNNNKL